MPSNPEIFMEHLDRIVGRKEDAIKMVECEDGGTKVSLFIYRNFPDIGMVTGFTYGLSIYPDPAWKNSRPEIILSMETEDMMWPFAAAFFSASFRGKKRFCWGDVFTTSAPLADDTKMDAVLIFAQSVLEKEDEVIQMEDYKINFSQFYPIYRSELEVYEKIGLEKFWKHDQFAPFNPKRAPIRG